MSPSGPVVPVGSALRSSSRPLLVVEGERTASTRRLRTSLAVVRADGWVVVRGWAAPLGRERVVCTGTVATEDDARRALLAAISGAGLIVRAAADQGTIDRFVDDLRRLGLVDHVDCACPAGDLDRRTLASEERSLLAMLDEGLSVREAADELGLGRRTADRRIAAARAALGVDSTAAAIATAFHRDVS